MKERERAREVGDSDSIISKSGALRYRTFHALGSLTFVSLGFRFASPQPLCFHPLRGFGKGNQRRLVQNFLESLNARPVSVWQGNCDNGVVIVAIRNFARLVNLN
jgi:hypothetical protein